MTTLCEHVRARIGDTGGVAALVGRVEEVAELTALVQAGALPASSPWAFVLPLGLDGGTPDAMTGVFRQPVTETVGVILVVQTPGDPKAKSAAQTLDALVEAVVARVCGYAPTDTTSDFALRSGRMVSVADGVAIYQLAFSIDDHLRIT